MLKKIPHTYAIIFYIIVVTAILTWLVPGGEYEREKKVINGKERTVIVDNSFHHVPHKGQTWQVFSAMFKGFKEKADIIVFIFMVGGAFMVVTKTKAIDTGIFKFLDFTKTLKRNKLLEKVGVDNIIIALIMLMFSFFGAIFGMSEETIPFIMILVPLSISMGYDSIVGVSMVFLAAGLGFAGALLNPFTIGIAQGIAGIPLFSGIEYRFVCWVVINIVGIAYVLNYAAKIRKDPTKSPVYEEDEYWRENQTKMEKDEKIKNMRPAWTVYGVVTLVLFIFSLTQPDTQIVAGVDLKFNLPILPVVTGLFAIGGFFSLRNSARMFVLVLLSLTILMLITGVMGYGWYMEEIAAIFFAMGIAAGVSVGFRPNEVVKHFLSGVKDIAAAALIVGFAGGIVELLNDGKIIDTLLHEISGSIDGLGSVASITMMYIFQSVLNIFIPSGSGQAALTMPIMAPLSDLLGISRQAAVMAYQFGDGFTNMITPTSGVLIGVLGVAKIPYDKWFKWAYPFLIIVIIVALLLLIPTVTMNLSGF